MIVFDLILNVITIYIMYKVIVMCCNIGFWHNKHLKDKK